VPSRELSEWWLGSKAGFGGEPGPAAPNCFTYAPGLVGYWHFDEGVGTVSRDFSQGHHDAVMSTATKPVWVKSDGLELVCP